VRQGGRLFVTDHSYDFVEQVFPEFIEFEGAQGAPPGQPEPHDAAELGPATDSVRATVLDKDLKAWLALPEVGALLPSGEVNLLGFLDSWAIMKSVNEKAGGRVWVTAPMVGPGGNVVRPLTATYDFRDTDGKGCGRVLFTSYHTHGDAPQLLPQERILEYLILEIGACGSIL
jgi:hypothetical protein